ncbi:MAG: hypothetical protein KAV87_12880 [Desulfobacteraceae bacterium]|nr:hypothetical protein [Desulfobacteraceae bacterium]
MPTVEEMLEDRIEEERDDMRYELHDDKRLEALESVLEKLNTFYDYLNSIDPDHPINIVDGGYTEESLQGLGSACEASQSYLMCEIQKESGKPDVHGN